MQNVGDYFPPVWIIGQKWQVEYFFEQKIDVALSAASALPENFNKHIEKWEYEIYGRETIHDKPHVIVRARPIEGVPDELKNSQVQMYFEETTKTLHGFKRLEKSGLGTPHIEYVKNPWQQQSFFTTDREHIIVDWPFIDAVQTQKQVGIGDLSFAQRSIIDHNGLIVELGNKKSTTVLTWLPGRPWWVFADKLIALPDRILHIQAKLVEENPATSPL